MAERETIYVAMGLHEEEDGAKTPSVRFFTDQAQAERQYHLYCAAAATSDYPVDTAMLMTTEGFVMESKCYKHDSQPEPQPEPEEEPVEQ